MKIKIEEKDVKKRLDVFLVEYFENKYPRKKISSFIEEFVLVNNQKQKISYKTKINDEIELSFDELLEFMEEKKELEPFDFKLDILFEDDDLIVLNKPKNMLTQQNLKEKRL